MKKKIIITMTSMFVGGAETSLLGLLDNIDYEKYDVDLFLFRHEGEFMPLIPEKVNLLPPVWQYGNFDVPIASLLTPKKLPFAFARLLSKVLAAISRKRQHKTTSMWTGMQYNCYCLNPLLPKIEGEYDLALSFLGTPFYLSKINAKKKLAWVHTDYSFIDFDKKIDKKAFKNIDAIVNVSEDCNNIFKSCFPELAHKCIVIENTLSKRIVLQRADELSAEKEIDKNSLSVLSIGRFSYQKNFENIPFICRKVLDKGIDIKWYIVGDGGAREEIEENKKQSKTENNVILLGKKSNPYPYIAACDIYAQPSRYEGKSVAVREAQMLLKPVIISRYETSAAQLKDGFDGVIAPMDNDGFAKELVSLIENKKMQKEISENEKNTDYSNSNELEKIYSFCE